MISIIYISNYYEIEHNAFHFKVAVGNSYEMEKVRGRKPYWSYIVDDPDHRVHTPDVHDFYGDIVEEELGGEVLYANNNDFRATLRFRHMGQYIWVEVKGSPSCGGTGINCYSITVIEED